MERILGIDYGRKKIGLALGDTKVRFAEPWRVLRYQDINVLNTEIKKVVEDMEIGKIIIGISEGKMAEETNEFGKKLEEKIGIPVIFQDETLTTLDAQRLSIEGKIKRKKRRGLEDAYSATLILQDYLDSL